jgi:hypothetical protein
MSHFPRRLIVLAVSLVAAACLAANALADPPTFSASCTSAAKILDARECTYTVANDTNTANAETLTINSLTDRIHGYDGDVAADLLPSLFVTPSGGATCNLTGSAPGAGNTSCTLPFGSSIASTPTSIYTLSADDFLLTGHLLLADASLAWRGPLSGPNVDSTQTSTLVEQMTSTTSASLVSDASGNEHPSVTVTGEPGKPTPVGNVTIDWFTSGDCTGTPTEFGPAGLQADGTLDAVAFSDTSGSSFRAHYLGDPGAPLYAPSDSACVQSTHPVVDPPVVTPASPADLIPLVAGMNIDSRLAADLTSRAQTAAAFVSSGRNACKTLDGFIRRVTDASHRRQLTGAQAQALLDAVNAVEAKLGC